MANLFDLFDKKLRDGSVLVSSEKVSLSTISDEASEREFAVKKSKSLQNVEFKIDYSDFANFVSFNSAEDYFNISGERMLNDYPYDGTVEDVQNFEDASDAYQKHLLSIWPKNSGHLRFFQPSGSYVRFDDTGKEDGSAQTSLLSPNTGSFSVEAWYRASSSSLTASSAMQFLFQKAAANGTGYSLYLSGSNVYFRVVSGSSVNEVSAIADAGENTFVAGVVDRSAYSGTISIFTGSASKFPVLVSSASLGFYTSLDIGSASFYIASGTISARTSALFTGSIGEVRVWKRARTLAELSSSFNSKMYAQRGLVGLWNFSETSSLNDGTLKTVVFDRSGHKLDGRIRNYYDAVRGSGSFVGGTSDPILFFDAPEVSSLVLEQQTSGSTYDRENDGNITRLFPESFFIEETENGTNVFKNFLYVIARLFDEIKTSISQFSKIYTVNYTDFDQAPDALLADVAKFYGWDFTGNFISADAFQYFLGKTVAGNLDANIDLDKKLYEIKNELWRRTLNNLSYIYKTKGTRESVEALLRSYGIRNNLFRVKEYASDVRTGLTPQRIIVDKSVWATAFGSSSLTASMYRSSSLQVLSGTDHTFEMRVKFPLTGSTGIQATISSGTLWAYSADTGSYYALVYAKDAFSSQTGSLFLTSSVGLLAKITGAGIFDGQWQNIAVVHSYVSGTVKIAVRDTDNGEINRTFVSSSAAPQIRSLLSTSSLCKTIVGSPKIAWGASFDTWNSAQYWAQEFRTWKLALDDSELDDHALNFQSYGLRRPRASYDRSLVNHWRLDAGTTASAAPTNGAQAFLEDVSSAPSVTYITGTNFSPGAAPAKFLNDYSYSAAPDLGWTDDKIRVIEGTRQKRADVIADSSVVAIEFNLVDALNEDITQLMSSFEELNSVLGTGASKYQETYAGLDHLRQQYFRRLQGRLNFRLFADMLEFFDRSFLTMVERLIPARATFLGDEFVVESHMLERPKFQYGRFLKQEDALTVDGVIVAVGPNAMRFTSGPGDVTLIQNSSEGSSLSGVATHPYISSVPRSVKG